MNDDHNGLQLKFPVPFTGRSGSLPKGADATAE